MMTPLVDLTDLAVVVTGGSTGIGSAITTQAHELGARVGVIDLAAPQGAVAAHIETHSRADVSSPAEVDTAIGQVSRELGGLDVLINNAGIAPAGAFEDITAEQWRRTMAINLDGSFHCSRAALPLLRRSGAGAIVNLASIAGRSYSRTANVAYAASKGGVIAMTRQLAFELAGEGIRVNCVCPGLVDTAIMSRNVTPDRMAMLLASIPLGRLAEPAEVAGLVCFLASSAAGYLTGSVVDITGGLS
jgi:NAD(P)-dependent dehydrogenase (short-subunit alcohol dehydrogenase family)